MSKCDEAMAQVTMKLALVVLCYHVIATAAATDYNQKCGAEPLVYDMDKLYYGTWSNPSYPKGDTKPLDCKLTLTRKKQKDPTDTYVQFRITYKD